MAFFVGDLVVSVFGCFVDEVSGDTVIADLVERAESCWRGRFILCLEVRCSPRTQTLPGTFH